jgi:hypothetical protein
MMVFVEPIIIVNQETIVLVLRSYWWNIKSIYLSSIERNTNPSPAPHEIRRSWSWNTRPVMLLARDVGIDLFRRLLDPLLDGVPGKDIHKPSHFSQTIRTTTQCWSKSIHQEFEESQSYNKLHSTVFHIQLIVISCSWNSPPQWILMIHYCKQKPVNGPHPESV